MTRHSTMIQWHPDLGGVHLGRARALGYAKSAVTAGQEVSVIDITKLEFLVLQSKEAFENGTPPDAIRQAQGMIRGAKHLVIFYLLWRGAMPALLKGFLEQGFRPGFALSKATTGEWPKKLWAGKTARIVITMGMPAFFHRWFYNIHTLKSLKRNILGFCGISPMQESLIGMEEAPDASTRAK